MNPTEKNFSRIFLTLSLTLFTLALVSAFALGTHTLWGNVKLKIESFEKPLVGGLLFFALWFATARIVPTLRTRDQVPLSNRWLLFISAIFFIWFFTLGALRVHWFAIGYDMGTYTNILFNTSQGHWFLESHKQFNMLGEHFMLASGLAAPLVALWKSPVALVFFECLLVSFSILAIHQLAYIKTRSAVWAFAFVALFLISPYTHKIMMDPYRPITMAIPVFLWALVALESKRRIWFWALVLFSFTIQENTPIFLFGLAVYLSLFQKGERVTGIILGVVSMGALALVMGVLMPHFYGGKRLGIMNDFWLDYQGSGFADILWNIIKNPLPLLKTVFRPGKVFQMVFFTSTAFFLCLLRPKYLLLFIFPMLFYQMTDFVYMNNFSRHYSSDPLVGVFYGAILAVSEYRVQIESWLKTAFSKKWALVPLTLWFLVLFSQFPDYRMNPNFAFIREAQSFMKDIPPGASLACSRREYYAPMAFRKDLTTFPGLRETDHILITRRDLAEYAEAYQALSKNPAYELVREGEFSLHFQKTAALPRPGGLRP